MAHAAEVMCSLRLAPFSSSWNSSCSSVQQLQLSMQSLWNSVNAESKQKGSHHQAMAGKHLYKHTRPHKHRLTLQSPHNQAVT